MRWTSARADDPRASCDRQGYTGALLYQYGLVSCRSTTGRFRRRSQAPFSEVLHANRWATLGIPLSLRPTLKRLDPFGGEFEGARCEICLPLFGHHSRESSLLSGRSPVGSYKEE